MASARTARLSRALLGTLVVSVLSLVPVAAQALPTPSAPTVQDVTAKLTDLAVSNEKLTEQLNAARIAVSQAQAKEHDLADKATDAQGRLSEAQRALAASVAAQYKSSSVSTAKALLTSHDGQGYVETIQSLDVLSQHQAAIASAAIDASNAASHADSDAKAAVADAVAKQNDVTAKQAELSKEIAQYQQMLASLTSAQVAAYHARENAASAAAAAAIDNLPASASGQAAQAVQAALSKRGDPYVWGAAGPNAFDCSGLTSWAWAQAGVSLPHNAAAQQRLGTHIPSSSLAPGDLVFFGSPAYHVGMYIGNGLYVQAPTSGDVVKVSVLANASDYSGATRVG